MQSPPLSFSVSLQISSAQYNFQAVRMVQAERVEQERQHQEFWDAYWARRAQETRQRAQFVATLFAWLARCRQADVGKIEGMLNLVL